MENNTQIRRLNLQYNLLAKNSLKILEKTVHNNLLLIDLKLKEKPMDLNGMRFDALPPAQLKSIDDCVRDNQLIAKVPPPPRVPRFASVSSHAGEGRRRRGQSAPGAQSASRAHSPLHPELRSPHTNPNSWFIDHNHTARNRKGAPPVLCLEVFL